MTAVLSLISALLAATISQVGAYLLYRRQRADGKSDKREEQDQLVRQGVVCMLHDRLYQACRYYIGRGEIDEAGYDNVTALYKAYSALDGNGTGTKLYQTVEAIWINSLSGGDD